MKKSLTLLALLALAALAVAGTPIVDNVAGYWIGRNTGDKVGFHGSTPVAQRAGSAQAAVTNVSTNGTAAAAADLAALKAEAELIGDDARANTVLLNELRAALVAKGLIKGAL